MPDDLTNTMVSFMNPLNSEDHGKGIVLISYPTETETMSVIKLESDGLLRHVPNAWINSK